MGKCLSLQSQKYEKSKNFDMFEVGKEINYSKFNSTVISTQKRKDISLIIWY
jgi:hypothetical protein